tara:strand:+ start:54 stop:218 length:165 start_codon:yes stop_codon:yes gene_type:complete
MSDPKAPLDATAIAIGAFSLVDLLPAVASVVTILWMLIRIYETATVQRWIGKNK